MLDPIVRSKLSQVAVERIKWLIDSGERRAGERLPTERELSEQLHVSRNSVREALRGLEALGLIQVRPGRGTFVRETPPENVDAASAKFPSFEADIDDLVEARTTIETRNCVLAAQRATLEDVETMQAAVDAMKRAFAASDVAGMVLADMEFHQAITRATKNKVLIRLEAAIAHQLIESRRVSISTGNPPLTISRHQLILEAIKAKDGDWAASIMLDHIRSVASRAQALRQQEQAPASGVESSHQQQLPG